LLRPCGEIRGHGAALGVQLSATDRRACAEMVAKKEECDRSLVYPSER